MNIIKTLLVACVAVLCQSGYAQSEYLLVNDVPYVEPNDTSAYRRERCTLDVYYPKGQRGFKTLVWIHGGGLVAGNKEIPELLKNSGFAVVAINYRLSPRGQNPAYTLDAAKAVAWVFNNIEKYGGDKSQIYVGGHSAGGYLTMMLALDKSYLAAEGIDADSVKAYFPVSGQSATHYTIRAERGLPKDLPVIDNYAPINHARKLGTHMVLISGDRSLEMLARYEENLYLKSVLEGVGNEYIPIHELSGMDHGTVVPPACLLIKDYMSDKRRF